MTDQSSQQKTLDTQCIERIGENVLTEQLIRGGIEVAKPIRDRGVDLIAYIDQTNEVDQFVSRPIQIKAASKRIFSIDKKYERIAGLLISFIWHIDSEEEAQVYAMSYAEAVEIADRFEWTNSPSWAKGRYTNTSPGKNVKELIAPFLMTPERWYSKLISENGTAS